MELDEETLRLIELGKKRDAQLAKLRGRRLSEEHKRAIAEGMRRRHAVIREALERTGYER